MRTCEDLIGHNDDLSGAGAVYVFKDGTGGWAQQRFLKTANKAFGTRLGAYVALDASGHELAVGAPYDHSEATGIGGDLQLGWAPESGAVYAYDLSRSP